VEGDVPQAYERALALPDTENALLAYEMNGAPLPPQHGFPLRLVVPGWYGMTNVKWLARITLLEQPFQGYQQAVGYRLYDADGVPGESVTRMLPRSLMIPPGVPDFLTRDRCLEPGPVTLSGRAWSGRPIEAVEVSTDGGASFAPALLEEPIGDSAWRGWRFEWDAPEGEHVLCSRATDTAGNRQPPEPAWNLKGYANNAVERIRVVVTAG
jgi:sulfane dehydrogenase subunit SoxC